MPTAQAQRVERAVSRAHARAQLGPFLIRMAQLGVAILVLFAIGTIGYAMIEDASIWRGFVWTLDTIATVGSIPEPKETGAQVLKVVLIVLGVGTLFYALVAIAEFFVAGYLSGLLRDRRAQRMTESLTDHYLICGFGRVGRQVARDLRAGRHRFVVIDTNPANRELADALGAPFIEGQPSDDEVLLKAGIERARAVLACVDSDAENIFIALTAREMRDDITVVARASVEDSEKKLKRAGADRVISPYKASGAVMARFAVSPQVSGVVDVSPEFRMEEIEVTEDAAGAERPIADVRGTSTIVALKRNGVLRPMPSLDTVLHAGDVLVAMGPEESMERLEGLFAPA